MINAIRIAIAALWLCFGLCLAEEQTGISDEEDIINYAIGYRLGGDFKRQDVQVQKEMLIKGLEDAVSGQKPRITAKEMRSALLALQQRVAAERQAKMEQQAQQAAENLKVAEAFLAENATREGVKSLPSGLQYKVLVDGSGSSPQKTDKVTVQYRGSLIDGTEFDSSYSRNQPATTGVDSVIPGWTEALQLMKEGAKWQLFIPPKLGYGTRDTGGKIPPNSTLIFEVELISIN
jgi:FKBP-type peptidyl-prolyl cis-trans isomerase FklB